MTQEEQTYHFEFHGTAGEYFKVWIVNLLLSIATLGIYSAWAKVRNRKYLYGSTVLDGAHFDYTANPVSILIGRVLVVIVVFGGGFLAGENIAGNLIYLSLVFLLLPWAMVRSYAFNARYTTYRNVAFGFIKSKRVYFGFYFYFAVLPLTLFAMMVAPLAFLGLGDAMFAMEGEGDISSLSNEEMVMGASGGLIAAILSVVAFFAMFFVLPFCVRAIHRLRASNTTWGDYQASFIPGRLGAYFAALFFGPLVVATVAGVVVGVVIALLTAILPEFAAIFAGIGGALGYLFGLVSISLVGVMLFRLYWQGFGLPEGGSIKCDFSLSGFTIKIIALNYLAIIFSLGLLYPWAQVRKIRYLAQHTTLHMPAGALDKILAKNREKEGALGDEFEAAEGLDLGIDIA